MIVVRCVQPGDVDALVALAHETGAGPHDFQAGSRCAERTRRARAPHACQ